MPVELRFLGKPRAFDADGREVEMPRGRPLAVLAYLAAHAEPVDRDELCRLLWPTAERTKALGSVRQALYTIRGHLGSHSFLTKDPVQLNRTEIRTDLDRFHRALATGQAGEAEFAQRKEVAVDLAILVCVECVG